MGLTSSKVVQSPGEARYVEEESKTYLGEKFTKVKPSGNAPPKERAIFIQPICLNHAAIEAADPDAMCEFYTKVLGFRKLPRPDLGFPGHWLEVGAPGRKMMIHIIGLDPSTPRAIHNWKDLYTKEPEAWFIRRASHLAFEVADFDAAEKALRTHGLEYSRHVLPEINMKQLFFYDPEGTYCICDLCFYLKSSCIKIMTLFSLSFSLLHWDQQQDMDWRLVFMMIQNSSSRNTTLSLLLKETSCRRRKKENCFPACADRLFFKENEIIMWVGVR
jgi:glyoxylase I family protein